MTLKNRSLAPTGPEAKIDPLEGLDEIGLMALRERIDMIIKPDLARLNMAEELGLQYRQGKHLLALIQNDNGTPANQKAQVFNAVAGMLEKIVKQQKIVYSAERMKRCESAILKVLMHAGSEDDKRRFFDLYGEFLAEDSDAAKAATE